MPSVCFLIQIRHKKRIKTRNLRISHVFLKNALFWPTRVSKDPYEHARGAGPRGYDRVFCPQIVITIRSTKPNCRSIPFTLPVFLLWGYIFPSQLGPQNLIAVQFRSPCPVFRFGGTYFLQHSLLPRGHLVLGQFWDDRVVTLAPPGFWNRSGGAARWPKGST